MKKLLFIAALALAPLGAFSACGHDDDDHAEPSPECDAIGTACHESTTELGISCHENAHDVWTAAECTAMSAACFAECVTADAGPPDGS